MNDRLAIVQGVRTAFVKAGTDFARLPAEELGRLVVTELIDRTEIDPRVIDGVVMGCVGEPSDAKNIARVIALLSGIPEERTAYTVNRNCASGMEAVTSAWEKIRAGRGEVFIVGGVESMSRYPLLFPESMGGALARLAKAKTPWKKLKALVGFRPSHFKPRVALIEGLTDPVSGLVMGQTAELLAADFHISREEQDRYALQSHRRAAAVRADGGLDDEVMEVRLPPEYDTVVSDDNGIRNDQTMEALARLKPLFDRSSGTVTAGNSCQVSDGAAALLVMSGQRARSMGYEPLGYLREYAYVGLDPSRMGLGPAIAIPEALKRAGLSLGDIDLVELNEAFAAQVIANVRAIGELREEILNVNGGAIALGHPVGATGTRLILTLLKEMERRSLGMGLATLCVGGGQGAALVLERT